MVKGVLCSTGALITRFNGRDPRLLKDILPGLEADGLEFMIYPSWDDKLDEVREIMLRLVNESGAFIPAVHADKRIGELLSLGSDEEIREAGMRFVRGCGIARELGAELLVLHLWGGPASDRNMERNLSVLGDYIRIAEEHGLLLTVENVVCAEGSPLEHVKEIMRAFPEARFTIDTKMAEFHLELPQTVGCSELWGGRAAHIHVNDYAGGYKDFSDLRVRHIGEGHVDFKPFFERILTCGYTGYATVESTSVLQDGSIDLPRLNRSLNAVKNALVRTTVS